MVMSRRKVLCMLFVLLAMGLCFSVCSDDPAPTPISYTIMTYNVNHFQYGASWGVLPRPSSVNLSHNGIANVVKTNAPDVLGLNEVSTADDEELFAGLLNNLEHPMPIHHFSGFTDGDNYIRHAYYSRLPVSEVSEIGGPDGIEGFQSVRKILKYKVSFPKARGGTADVWFYGCHLQAFNGEPNETIRYNEAKAFNGYIRAHHNLKTDYVVIWGDMNTNVGRDWPSNRGLGPANNTAENPRGTPGDCTIDYLEMRNGSDPDEYFTSLTLAGVYPHTTYATATWATGLPLDHIILSPALYNTHYVGESVKRLSAGDYQGVGQNPTDHYPVRCQLAF